MPTRRLTYFNELANSLFALEDELQKMLDFGSLAQAILGTNTLLNGFDCTPNSPADLTVDVAGGTIFSYEDIDATDFGELPSQIPADTTNQVLKYATRVGSTSFSFTPPVTAGFSRNDLIQIAFQEADGDSQNIPFWNGVSSGVPNPPLFSVKNVRRIDSVVINVKAGTPASTGTQTTPTPDAGYVGAWVVTTAQGQTTITSGNIAEYASAPFITETLTEKISQATADLRYARLASTNTFTQLQTMPCYYASVYRNAAQAVANTNTAVKIQFDNVEADPYSMWDNVNYRFIPNRVGKYLLSCNVFGSNVPSGDWYVEVYVNGSRFRRLGQQIATNNDEVICGCTIIPITSLSDYIELNVINNTSGNFNTGNGQAFTSMQIHYIGS